MTETPTETTPNTGDTTKLGPTAEQQLAEMLGGGEAAQQLQVLRELMVRVQLPPVPILIMYNPVTGQANVHEPSGSIPPEALMSALGAAQQSISNGMLRERVAAQSMPKATKRGRR